MFQKTGEEIERASSNQLLIVFWQILFAFSSSYPFPLKDDRFMSHEPDHLRLMRDKQIGQAQITLQILEEI